MKIRYCPKCGKAGLKWADSNGKGDDGLTDYERYEQYSRGELSKQNFSLRYCPRCKEWVNPDVGANIDQHKIR
jgi:ssDNA-binding Zn-finger/Zn-ribbon topoisomerase 1